jgi:hypothetical protein
MEEQKKEWELMNRLSIMGYQIIALRTWRFHKNMIQAFSTYLEGDLEVVSELSEVRGFTVHCLPFACRFQLVGKNRCQQQPVGLILSSLPKTFHGINSHYQPSHTNKCTSQLQVMAYHV